jgi:hypothetical protein
MENGKRLTVSLKIEDLTQILHFWTFYSNEMKIYVYTESHT